MVKFLQVFCLKRFDTYAFFFFSSLGILFVCFIWSIFRLQGFIVPVLPLLEEAKRRKRSEIILWFWKAVKLLTNLKEQCSILL